MRDKSKRVLTAGNSLLDIHNKYINMSAAKQVWEQSKKTDMMDEDPPNKESSNWKYRKTT